MKPNYHWRRLQRCFQKGKEQGKYLSENYIKQFWSSYHALMEQGQSKKRLEEMRILAHCFPFKEDLTLKDWVQ